jgi:hypothetical protein
VTSWDRCRELALQNAAFGTEYSSHPHRREGESRLARSAKRTALKDETPRAQSCETHCDRLTAASTGADTVGLSEEKPWGQHGSYGIPRVQAKEVTERLIPGVVSGLSSHEGSTATRED